MSSGSESAKPSGRHLRLYVAGDSPGARRALDNRQRLIDGLSGHLAIDIVDILVEPAEAERAGILATPTLSDDSVTPPRRLVGDIGNIAQVFDYFGIGRKDGAR